MDLPSREKIPIVYCFLPFVIVKCLYMWTPTGKKCRFVDIVVLLVFVFL